MPLHWGGIETTNEQIDIRHLLEIFCDGTLYHFCCAVSGKWPDDTRGLAVARSKPW